MKSAGIFLIVATSLAGCAQWSQFPELEPVQPGDDIRDCGSLDKEIGSANALRDAIIDELLRRRGSMTTYTVGAAVLNPFNVGGRVLRHSRVAARYLRAATAAEDRMQRLLSRKREMACAEAVTADGPQTEYELLTQIDDLERRWLAGDIPLADYRDTRNTLFDLLRPGTPRATTQ